MLMTNVSMRCSIYLHSQPALTVQMPLGSCWEFCAKVCRFKDCSYKSFIVLKVSTGIITMILLRLKHVRVKQSPICTFALWRGIHAHTQTYIHVNSAAQRNSVLLKSNLHFCLFCTWGRRSV